MKNEKLNINLSRLMVRLIRVMMLEKEKFLKEEERNLIRKRKN